MDLPIDFVACACAIRALSRSIALLALAAVAGSFAVGTVAGPTAGSAFKLFPVHSILLRSELGRVFFNLAKIRFAVFDLAIFLRPFGKVVV